MRVPKRMLLGTNLMGKKERTRGRNLGPPLPAHGREHDAPGGTLTVYGGERYGPCRRAHLLSGMC